MWNGNESGRYIADIESIGMEDRLMGCITFMKISR